MGAPKESRESREARLRDRLHAERELRKVSKENAGSWTRDFRAAFLKPSIFKISTMMKGSS